MPAEPDRRGQPTAALAWTWEQDEQFRFTRISPAPGPWFDPGISLGHVLWAIPGSRSLSEPWAAHRARLLRGEPFTNFEHLVLPTDGSAPRYLSTSARPRHDADGRFLGYVGETRDITADVDQRADTTGTRELLRLAAQLGKFGAWTSDLRTGMTTWSVELQGVHGCPFARECTNDQTLDLFAPEARPVLQEAFTKCASEGTPYDLELQIVDEAGQRTWVRVIGVAKRDAEGRITHVQGAYQDIQESKEVSEYNRAWADRFRVTLDSLSDGFAIVGRDWRVTYANRFAAQSVGLDLAEAVGRIFWDLFPGVRETVFGEHYVAAMEQRETRLFEEYYEPLDKWFRVSAFPMQEGIAISFSDVSAAHRERAHLVELNAELERRVRERTAQLEALNADLKAFSYSVAHDLRSPIGRMAGFAKELQHRAWPVLDERSRHFLRRIQASANDMEDMTRGLITLFQVAHGSLDLHDLDLAAIARKSVDALRQSGRVPPSAAITIDAPLRIRADPSLMAIVMDNLIDNALKYSRDRGQPAVHIGSDVEGGTRRYFVRDNGVGFDDADAGTLFQPFTRLHGPEFEGSGIGLATAHKVVTMHRGRMWAQARPGEGATFYFTVAGPAAP
ncbi:PAS domain-containing protein [Ramlibacter algicola]|uniref:histidine kinase n=1 Tax=Ramlibacter algicola TaxID=2795217 RepID=A0A934USW9_9BURK|nr:PAS domain-containing protein [Ramlibacter algicola]MBK0394705.1 PAS domain-containing protein [Ramlibacter algicola]